MYKDIADDWSMLYNGTDRLIAVAAGGKSGFQIMDESLFDLYKKGE
jgi:hypothetical protein